MLNKVVTVFSALCSEVQEMKQKVLCVCVYVCVCMCDVGVYVLTDQLRVYLPREANKVALLSSVPYLPSLAPPLSCTSAGCHEVLPPTVTV